MAVTNFRPDSFYGRAASIGLNVALVFIRRRAHPGNVAATRAAVSSIRRRVNLSYPRGGFAGIHRTLQRLAEISVRNTRYNSVFTFCILKHLSFFFK